MQTRIMKLAASAFLVMPLLAAPALTAGGGGGNGGSDGQNQCPAGKVWNKKTKHLVAGHQRLDALKKQHGDKLAIKDGALVAPGGLRFPIRVVNWPVEKEKAANLAANSPFLAGSFDPGGLEDVLRDLNAADGLESLVADLRLGELLPAAGDLLPEKEGGGKSNGAGDGDEVPAGNSEWLTFSCPLTAAQHQLPALRGGAGDLVVRHPCRLRPSRRCACARSERSVSGSRRRSRCPCRRRR